jgi:hypothetical protein
MDYPTKDTSLLEKIGVYEGIPINDIPKRFDAILEDAKKRLISLESFIDSDGCPETEEMNHDFLSEVESAYILKLKMRYDDLSKLAKK